METLSRMTSTTIYEGFLSGFFMRPAKVNISNFLFADNNLVFYEAKPNHLSYLRALFLCFEAVSKLKINLTKLELVLVGNVENVYGLASILGCGFLLCL